MYFVILKNENPVSHAHWERACQNLSQDYSVVNLVSAYWLEEIKERTETGNVCFLACPPGISSLYKQMYDEKIYIISKVLGQQVYPSYESILLHENKRTLSYWLEAKDIPHPGTFVYYDKARAIEYLDNAEYPVVAKTSIGAAGSGVRILKDRIAAQKYIKRAFSPKGIRQKSGPNFRMGDWRNRLVNFIKNSEHRKSRLYEYKAVSNNYQRGFVIFQKYVPHDFEWRIVRIGSGYFGYQKVKVGDKASGAKNIRFETPPTDLLDFVEEICIENNFFTMAIDLFVNSGNGYLVNEMQCVFGHVKKYLCLVNGQEGKFEKIEGEWKFIGGHFNENQSYNERLRQYIKYHG